MFDWFKKKKPRSEEEVAKRHLHTDKCQWGCGEGAKSLETYLNGLGQESVGGQDIYSGSVKFSV
jgi:hypothetical protein